MSDPGHPDQPVDPGPPIDATQRLPQYTPQDPPGPGGPGGPGEPPPGGGGPDDGSGDESFWRSVPPWAAALAGGVVVALVVLLIVLLGGGDDGDDDVATDATPEVTETPTVEEAATAEPTEEPTAEPDATPTPQATPTPAPTATPEPAATPEPPPVDPEVYASAVWPWFDSDVRYTDPVAAVRGFAEEFVGFTDPILGEFMQGDSRSGEVEITPRENAPVTTVFVRQLGPDDSWWVLGSATENIEIDEPDALDEISSPLEVRGSALAFEGTVNIDIRADGETDPLFEGFVTGGGGEMAPFDDDLDWDDPGEGSGAVVFKTINAEDGSIWQAAVVRVTFG